jgi:hypothetical protein
LTAERFPDDESDEEEVLSVFEIIAHWVKANWLWVAVFSVITMIASLASVSLLLVSLPSDYFSRKKQFSRIRHPVLRMFFIVLKNVIGVFALIAGFIMLFTPGQGALTVLVGVILCDFPGKRKLERQLIARPLVLSTINRIRARYRRPPIVVEEENEEM